MRGVDLFCGDQMQLYDLRIWTVDSSLWSTITDDVQNGKPLKIGNEPRGGFTLLTPEQNTVVFLTNEGSQGLLQFDPFDPKKGSRKIRYRLWKSPSFQPPANEQETPQAESPNWEPVIEVTLHAADAEGAECGWSHSAQQVRRMSGVDTAELAKNIRELHESYEFQSWQVQNRVSFMAQRTKGWKNQPSIVKQNIQRGGAADGFALIGFDLLALPVRSSAFTDLNVVAAQDIFASEPPNRSHSSTVFGEFDEYPLLPQTHVFRHQSGKIGLVQITESDVKNGTLSFRYKMAAKAAAVVDDEQLKPHEEEAPTAVQEPAPDKLHIADRSGNYDLGKGRTLKIDASGADEQWFEIRWPANGEWKKSRLRIPVAIRDIDVAKLRMQPRIQIAIVPQDEGKNNGKARERRLVTVEPTIDWKIVWEENADDVWFEHSRQAAIVTRLTTANPGQVTATHYYRSMLPPFTESRDVPDRIRIRHPVSVQSVLMALFSPLVRPANEGADQLKRAAESSADWKVIALNTDANGKLSGTVTIPVETVVRPAIDSPQTRAAGVIRGTLLKPDGTPAAGYIVYAEDGFDRIRSPSSGMPDPLEPTTTKEDGSFEMAIKRMKPPAYHFEPSAYFLWAAKEHLKISEEFAPVEIPVPTNGDVGKIRFSRGRIVTGRVVGLDGKGLANIQISSRREPARSRGLAELLNDRSARTDEDGAFTLAPLDAGKHLLRIITKDLGDDRLSVAFANQLIDVPDTQPLYLDGFAVKGNLRIVEENHDAIEINFSPLKTVKIALDVTVNRSNPEFSDFLMVIVGQLVSKKYDPGTLWTRNETMKLTQGHFTIAVPEGLTHASIRAAPIHGRAGDKPEFIWQRPNHAPEKTIDQLELGTVSEPLGLELTVSDAAVD